MISIHNITKSFGNLAVLKGINFDVEKQEVVAIVGASGAGKTTLLQIIGTLSRPDSGEVVINSVNVGNLKDRALARFRNQHIGFVFQFHHLLPEFTALENVCIPAFIAGNGKKEAVEKATEILMALGLKDRLEHKPAELSGGEQQRVAVARALINNPSIILADEPSGNLDSKNKKELHELFLSLPERFGQTLVIVTHDQELASLADRKLTIADGYINS